MQRAQSSDTPGWWKSLTLRSSKQVAWPGVNQKAPLDQPFTNVRVLASIEGNRVSRWHSRTEYRGRYELPVLRSPLHVSASKTGRSWAVCAMMMIGAAQ